MRVCAVSNPSKILTKILATEETPTNLKSQGTGFLAGSTTQLKRTKIIAMPSFESKVFGIKVFGIITR